MVIFKYSFGFLFFLQFIIPTVFKIKGNNRNNMALVEAHSTNIERDSFMLGMQKIVFLVVYFLIRKI